MKTFKITKDEVKHALITEPLKAGTFFHTKEDSRWVPENGKCSVCAVGAILRNTRDKFFNSDDGFNVTGYLCGASSIDAAYDFNNFMSILSCEFEAASNIKGQSKEHYIDDTERIDSDSDDMRMFLLFLTEAFCPDVLEF